jgi:hypothetical protein
LIVDDETIKQVHFANCLCPDATVCEVYNHDDDYGGLRLVNVPDELLTQYMDIRVWGYDGEMTKYEQVIEVEKRTKPSDYIYTPEEVKTWEALAAQITQLKDSVFDLSNNVSVSLSIFEERLKAVDERVDFASNKAIDLTDRIDGLESRITTCEEYLGIGVGPGPGDSGEIIIDGTPYWIDYPMTFEEMLGNIATNISFDTCPACGSDFSHITMDYENGRVLWRDDCGEGDYTAYLTQYDSPVSPYQTVYPGESFEVVYESDGPGVEGDYISINDSMTYSIISGKTFRQMIDGTDITFLNECSGCHSNMVSAFDVGEDNRVYFYDYCSDCQPGPPGYLTHYITAEPVSADEPIYNGAMFNLCWDDI